MVKNLIYVLVVLAVFLGAWMLLRKTLKDEIRTSVEFRLDASKISVPEPPPWIPANFIEEVLFLASLDHEESVLDKRLPEKLAAAFSANTWVRRVNSVRIRYPGEVHVDLEYRSPCCLVDVPARDGYSPVDADGILLPTDYFIHIAPEAVDDYLIVLGAQSNPIGQNFGEPWGDRAVEGAARIAYLLGKDAMKFGIEKIRILPIRTIAPDGSFIHDSELVPRYELVSFKGRVLAWGRCEYDESVSGYDSLDEAANDSPERRKKDRLYEQLRLCGSLENLPESFSL